MIIKARVKFNDNAHARNRARSGEQNKSMTMNLGMRHLLPKIRMHPHMPRMQQNYRI